MFFGPVQYLNMHCSKLLESLLQLLYDAVITFIRQEKYRQVVYILFAHALCMKFLKIC